MKPIDSVQYNLPGAILSVCKTGKKIQHYCSGLSVIQENIPFVPNQLLQIGRITRTFSATAILKLVESGLVELDKPLQLLAREHSLDGGRLRLIVDQYPYLKPLTLRELLNQTSGLPAYDQTMRYALMFSTKPQKVWQAEGYLDLITGKEVRFRLGYQLPQRGIFGDSATNYIVVSLIMEAITGQRVSQHMQWFFAELGLKDSYYASYGVLDKRLYPQSAHGYLPISHPQADAFQRLPILTYNDNRELQVYDVTTAYNFNGLMDSASMSTTTDLINFMQALVKGKILTSGFKEMFATVPITCKMDTSHQRDFYGLGVYKSLSERFGPIIWNAGNSYGYGTLMAYALEQDVAFALAVNVSRHIISLHNERIVADVIQRVLG